MNQKKKLPIIILIVGIVLIIAAVIVSILTVSHTRYKNETYCSDSAMCYIYDGVFLKFYEDEDETEDDYLDILWHSCIYTGLLNTCKEKILSWDENKMYVQEDKNSIEGYYNVKVRFKGEEKVDLTGKGYQNKKLDLYFTNTYQVIVSGENKSQEICNYYIEAYEFDDYTSVRYECPNKSYDKEDVHHTYTFDIKKDLVMGFKKASKEDLKHIDFSYYDEEYQPIIKDEYYITGHYKVENNPPYSYEEEVWFNAKEVRIKTSNYDQSFPLSITEVNDKYILYDIKGFGDRYYYDLEQKTICSYGTCYEKVGE